MGLENQPQKALILSVGGTLEPIIKAIMEHRPNAVCFFASQESLRNVGPVLDGARAKWAPSSTYTVLVDDPEDLPHCYERALRCAIWMEQQGIPPSSVIVDYTGGTKAMTAALAIATIGKGFRFSYVGGAERNKGGVGVVVTGTEIIHEGLDPWQLFAVEERRRFTLYFGAYQFEAAIGVLRASLDRGMLSDPQKKLFEVLVEVSVGYLEWDRFNHKEAIRKLSRGEQGLETFSEITGDPKIRTFAGEVSQNLAFLRRLQEESRQFNVVCWTMVEDLVANAERRAKEGKYDDAVARLYRATEMVAQIRFRQTPLECRTDEVPPEKVPESLREEFRQRYLDPEKGKLRLPLYAAFRILEALRTEEGKTFFAREKEFRSLLSARNQSLLAHGVTSVQPETYRQFKELVCETFGIADLPAFPELDL